MVVQLIVDVPLSGLTLQIRQQKNSIVICQPPCRNFQNCLNMSVQGNIKAELMAH